MSTKKDFDAITTAMNSGNDEELDRLMAIEPEPEEEIEEVVEEVELPDESDAKKEESEESPEVEVPEDEPNEAASAAASSAERDRELQKLRSDAGRVPFIQKRMAELEREVRAYKARDSQNAPSKNGGANLKDIHLDEETQREIDELREVDPVMAKTLERIAKTAQATATAKVDHAVNTMTQIDQEKEEFNFLLEQKADLVREIPQADAIFATPEWSQWKNSLTPGQRALAESSYASEVKQAVYAFAAVMQNHTQANQPQETPAGNKELKEARDRKVGASAEVKASAAKKAVELDSDAYFEEMYNKIGKESHILK